MDNVHELIAAVKRARSECVRDVARRVSARAGDGSQPAGRRCRVREEALGGQVVRDQHVDPAAHDGAADRFVLALAAGDADGAVDVAQLLERDADDAAIDVRGSTGPPSASKKRRQMSPTAPLRAERLELLLGEDVAAALQQRRRLERADARPARA